MNRLISAVRDDRSEESRSKILASKRGILYSDLPADLEYDSEESDYDFVIK